MDYVPSFVIPAIIPTLLEDEGFKIDSGGEKNTIDLVLDKFYEIILPTYQDIMHSLKKDESEIVSYNLILEYLKLIRDNTKTNKIDELNEIFDNKQDIENVERIVLGEITFLNKKIKELEDIIKKTKKRRIIKNKNYRNSNYIKLDLDL